MLDPDTLDGFDLKILAALQADGRLTNQDLAERVNLSPSQCSRRRIRLEERGILRGYLADIDPGRLGLDVVVFTKVALAAHSRDNARRFADLVRGLDCVLEAHALTGDSDYLLKMILPDLRALSAVVNEMLLPHESVASVRTSVVLTTLKEAGTLPLGSVPRLSEREVSPRTPGQGGQVSSMATSRRVPTTRTG
ncbi:Lrp/AsnC family transcriptional regulator [Methylobacterium sp. JK268]